MWSPNRSYCHPSAKFWNGTTFVLITNILIHDKIILSTQSLTKNNKKEIKTALRVQFWHQTHNNRGICNSMVGQSYQIMGSHWLDTQNTSIFVLFFKKNRGLRRRKTIFFYTRYIGRIQNAINNSPSYINNINIILRIPCNSFQVFHNLIQRRVITATNRSQSQEQVRFQLKRCY